MVSELQHLNVRIEQLNQAVYAAPDSAVETRAAEPKAAASTAPANDTLADRCVVKDGCATLARQAHTDLLTPAVIWTPEKLQRVFKNQLATQCPVCTTTFRITPDQMRVSAGWVRCGRCNQVFDSNATMVALKPNTVHINKFGTG